MASAATSVRYRFTRFELQLDEHRLLADGSEVRLGGHAFDLLAALVERPGHLVTKEQLLQRVWGKVVVEENTVQANVSALRKVLGASAITTVPGQGYRFALLVQPVDGPVATLHATHNLPQQLTRFIGRERQISEIRSALSSTRLLTITGAGGCGKTRLAQQVAAALLQEFADGVRLVELAPLAHPTLVAHAVAKALAVEAQPGRELDDAMAEWLSSRQLLLVLDNAEHVLEACARLADGLLRRSAQLVILATSRERLGIDGELTYRLPPLSVDSGADDGLASEAARLFVDRARLHRPDFEVAGVDVDALVSICRRLDGIALAIELAASQMRMLSVEALSQRLDDRFRVLTGGSRTALPHHRTLRSLIDWSHELLTEAEKVVLWRASVFAGGWTLQAAERVCGGEGIEPGDILELLTSLTDKSLVSTDTKGGRTRFGMLETVRHYAQERLHASGAAGATRKRHVAHLIEMAAGLDAPEGIAALRALSQLDLEHDNLRAALAWCEREPAHSLSGLRLAGLLGLYWELRGLHGEGRAWLARLLAVAPADEQSEVRAVALQVSGQCLNRAGDAAEAAVAVQEAVALLRRLGERRWLGRALTVLGEVQQYRGHIVEARGHYDEALSLAREVGDLRDILSAINGQARSAFQLGDHAAAQTLVNEALNPSRTVGPWIAADLLVVSSIVSRDRGDLTGARAALRESLEHYRECGQNTGMAKVLVHLAKVSQDEPDIPAAWFELRQASDWLPGGCNLWLEWLETAAALSADSGRAIEAAQVWGCVQRHREQWSLSWRPRRHERLQAAAQRALSDDAAFQRALTEGRAWTLDEGTRHAWVLGDAPEP